MPGGQPMPRPSALRARLQKSHTVQNDNQQPGTIARQSSTIHGQQQQQRQHSPSSHQSSQDSRMRKAMKKLEIALKMKSLEHT